MYDYKLKLLHNFFILFKNDSELKVILLHWALAESIIKLYQTLGEEQRWGDFYGILIYTAWTESKQHYFFSHLMTANGSFDLFVLEECT